MPSLPIVIRNVHGVEEFWIPSEGGKDERAPLHNTRLSDQGEGLSPPQFEASTGPRFVFQPKLVSMESDTDADANRLLQCFESVAGSQPSEGRDMNQAKARSEAKRPIDTVYRAWKSEDREIQASIGDLQEWMYQVGQIGEPHFGETATRLRPLRERLVKHFEREDEMMLEIADSHVAPAQRTSDVRRQSFHDRDVVLSHLDDLIDRLNQLDPPFASWQRAVEEVGDLVDLLVQHEESEAKNIQSILDAIRGA